MIRKSSFENHFVFTEVNSDWSIDSERNYNDIKLQITCNVEGFDGPISLHKEQNVTLIRKISSFTTF